MTAAEMAEHAQLAVGEDEGDCAATVVYEEPDRAYRLSREWAHHALLFLDALSNRCCYVGDRSYCEICLSVQGDPERKIPR